MVLFPCPPGQSRPHGTDHGDPGHQHTLPHTHEYDGEFDEHAGKGHGHDHSDSDEDEHAGKGHGHDDSDEDDHRGEGKGHGHDDSDEDEHEPERLDCDMK